MRAPEGAPAIGSLWFAAPTLDGDGLAGLANPFAPPVLGANLLLATLNFRAILDFAQTPLDASVTAGDLTEGFPLAFPAPPGARLSGHPEGADITAQ